MHSAKADFLTISCGGATCTPAWSERSEDNPRSCFSAILKKNRSWHAPPIGCHYFACRAFHSQRMPRDFHRCPHDGPVVKRDNRGMARECALVNREFDRVIRESGALTIDSLLFRIDSPISPAGSNFISSSDAP